MNTKLLHKINMETTKMEEHFKDTHRILKNKRTMVVVAVFGVITCIATFIFSTWLVARFFDKYAIRFQSPIRLQIVKPIYLEERRPIYIKVVVTPTPEPIKRSANEKEIVLAQKHGDVLWKIYQLETQRGKEDHCRNTGKGWGGFGIMSDGEIVCYESFERTVNRAEYWLTQFGVDRDLVDALCIWNLGRNVVNNKVVPHINCGYYQKYLQVL